MDAKFRSENRKGGLRPLVAVTLLLTCLNSLHASGYICAEGGGGLAKGKWATGVFKWMIEHGGNRRVAVLSYHPEEDKDVARVFRENGALEVKPLAIPDRESADQEHIAAQIMAANIVWLRGGDQSKYVLNWRGTRTESAIRAVYDRGGVIGGTSAGAAVLGEAIYDAFNGSLTSPEALSNAYHPVLTLTTGFLSLTPGVLFDTHFNERGRIGRLAVMLSRRYEDAQQDLLGIGLDYRTALCVSPDLTAEVRGEGAVTLLSRTDQTQQILSRGQPPTITDLSWASLTQGYVVDLKTREIIKRPAGIIEIGPGQIEPSFTACTIDGGSIQDRSIGSTVLSDGDNPRAFFEGSLSASKGAGLLAPALVLTAVWADDRRIENRVGGASWILANHPGQLAILAGHGISISACEPAILQVHSLKPDAASCLILDSHGATRVTGPVSQAPAAAPRVRQSVAMENGRLHILTDGAFYNARRHRPVLAKRPHDLNVDGLVDRDDIRTFACMTTGMPASPWQRIVADANRDGRIDRDDDAAFAQAMLDDVR